MPIKNKPKVCLKSPGKDPKASSAHSLGRSVPGLMRQTLHLQVELSACGPGLGWLWFGCSIHLSTKLSSTQAELGRQCSSQNEKVNQTQVREVMVHPVCMWYVQPYKYIIPDRTNTTYSYTRSRLGTVQLMNFIMYAAVNRAGGLAEGGGQRMVH